MDGLLSLIASLERFRPSAWMVIVGTPLTAVYAFVCAAYCGRLRIRRGVRAPYTRKIFHFLIISAAGVVHLTGGLGGVTVFGSVVTVAVVYGVVRGDDFPFYEALARPTDRPHRTLFIVVPLVTTALGGVLANVFFAPYAPVGYMVTGWGDAVGEPVGTRWGRHRYKVPSLAGVPATRSLEGSAAVLVSGTLAATLVMLWMGIPLSQSLGVGFACGFGAAIVEAVSSHGLDNLTVQVAAAATAFLLLG